MSVRGRSSKRNDLQVKGGLRQARSWQKHKGQMYMCWQAAAQATRTCADSDRSTGHVYTYADSSRISPKGPVTWMHMLAPGHLHICKNDWCGPGSPDYIIHRSSKCAELCSGRWVGVKWTVQYTQVHMYLYSHYNNCYASVSLPTPQSATPWHYKYI